ncbi:4'-phosphopantetheinyl transferase family protein [Trujillonella endophytica]|uniref:4'-phosphopantetheinyl transferase n=1 Tax=Trujillonella endophytica TaxID=673521 RepID=A0A1H8W4I1_9ACTN|nr:4'-phosphopantetheinyl transferase superfamily protein [Trujillella endophytica]SEP22539.1 4'-phosphopantetheinyl transferase [Trujillella endophytica]
MRVWTLDLHDPHWDEAAAARLLLPAERRRAGEGTPEVARRRVLLRSALRRVLGRLLGMAPQDVPLDVRAGRPVLSGGAAHLAVSSSSSGALGVVAVSRSGGLGIDVERLDEGFRLAAERDWLTEAEAGAIARRGPSEQPSLLLRCWTQKEAVLKAAGVGLWRPPRSVSTPLSARGRVGPWSVGPVPLPAPYVGSVAVDSRRSPRVRVARLAPAGCA